MKNLFIIMLLIVFFNCSHRSHSSEMMDEIFMQNYEGFSVGDGVEICLPILNVNGSMSIVYRHSYPYSLDYSDMDGSITIRGTLLSKEKTSIENESEDWKEDLIYTLKVDSILSKVEGFELMSDTLLLSVYAYARPIIRANTHPPND